MWDLIAPISTIVITVVGAVWSLAWWLSHQFATTRSLVYDQIEKLETNILQKLEYHERHDDSRFSDLHNEISSRIANLRNDIWDLRLRNAAIDGRKLVKSEDQTADY